MSNIYVTLPVPVGNGIGASVDVSALGALKTVVAVGSAVCTINIEFNNDPAQAGGWQSFATIANSGLFVGYAAVRWMRIRVSNYNVNVGGTSSVNVGSTDDGSQFVALPVLAGNGAGAPVDVSALVGTFKTVQVGGAFQGTLIVEVSEDGTTEWGQPFSFGSPGAASLVIVARWMRTRRIGVPVINPGAPVVNVGFAFQNVAGGGGAALPPDGNYGDVTVSLGGTQWDVSPLPESRIIGLTADLALLSAAIAASVPSTRVVNATAPLTIDGGASADLGADVTIAIDTSGLVPSTRVINATSPLTIDGGASADLGADVTIAIDISALVTSLNTRLGQFGTGTDLTHTMDGTTAVTGCTLTNPGPAGVYKATRELFFLDLTINAGITFLPDGYPICVKGTLTNNGDINANGGDATGIVQGQPATTTPRPLPIGLAGVTNSATGLASGGAPRGFDATAAPGGTAPALGNVGPANSGANGGIGHGGGGGAGGNNLGIGIGSAGLAGGNVVLVSPTSNGDIQTLQSALSGRVCNSFTLYTMGSTGGGGANGNPVGNGGASGASGGYIVLKVFKFAGAGTIRSRGGAGAAGAAGGGGGGGAGSPGGVIVIQTADLVGPVTDVSGGLGGAGGPGNGGTGQPGGRGGDSGAGLSLLYN